MQTPDLLLNLIYVSEMANKSPASSEDPKNKPLMVFYTETQTIVNDFNDEIIDSFIDYVGGKEFTLADWHEYFFIDEQKHVGGLASIVYSFHHSSGYSLNESLTSIWLLKANVSTRLQNLSYDYCYNQLPEEAS